VEMKAADEGRRLCHTYLAGPTPSFPPFGGERAWEGKQEEVWVASRAHRTAPLP